MASTTETGHAKNVANFENIIIRCTAFGADYNPSKTNISLTALNELLTRAKAAMTAVNSTNPALSQAIAAREAVFTPLSKLLTRVVSAYAASDTLQSNIDNAKTVLRKLQGRRASTKTTTTETNPQNPNTTTTTTTHSVSQMSFDSRIENLDRLIQILQADTAYKPNETELQITNLQALLNDLRKKNTDVITASTPIANARIERDNILYLAPDSVYEAVKTIKNYIKSLYGASSPQYKQIASISFDKINK